MALGDAYSLATARLGWEATRAELESYLGGSLPDNSRAPATQLRSVWTNARRASRRYHVAWDLDPGGVRITCGDKTITPPKRCRVLRTLREVRAAERDRALHDLPNQGMVLACAAADRASSHFMRTGAFTTFADWRFVHRARLNLLPLNGARMWGAPGRDQRCRTCGYERETLPHVVCHCLPRSALYQARHNAIVARLRTAASRDFTNLLPLNGARMWGAPGRDQRCRTCGYERETLPHVVCHCLPRSALYQARHNAIVARLRTAASRDFTVAHDNQVVGDTGLRPDLVLVRGEEAIVLDVTCPFENTPEAFTNARNAKLARYQPVAAFLRRRYQRVTVDAVIVGALGTWDAANDSVLRRHCSRPYLRLFKKLCVSAVIAASREIYHTHLRHGR
ncbi:hypothetical protein MTO96_042880 [Rhipicephalus appendiculatus]